MVSHGRGSWESTVGDLAYDELARQRERREREREEEEERQLRREAEEFAKLETGHILSLASELMSHDNHMTVCVHIKLNCNALCRQVLCLCMSCTLT